MRVTYVYKAVLQIHAACEYKESRPTVSLQNLLIVTMKKLLIHWQQWKLESEFHLCLWERIDSEVLFPTCYCFALVRTSPELIKEKNLSSRFETFKRAHRDYPWTNKPFENANGWRLVLQFPCDCFSQVHSVMYFKYALLAWRCCLVSPAKLCKELTSGRSNPKQWLLLW